MENKIQQDPTKFYGMLEKNAMESISIGIKILQVPTRLYGILDKNAMKSISIANNILNILLDTRQKCYGVHINSKQHPTRF